MIKGSMLSYCRDLVRSRHLAGAHWEEVMRLAVREAGHGVGVRGAINLINPNLEALLAYFK